MFLSLGASGERSCRRRKFWILFPPFPRVSTLFPCWQVCFACTRMVAVTTLSPHRAQQQTGRIPMPIGLVVTRGGNLAPTRLSRDQSSGLHARGGGSDQLMLPRKVVSSSLLHSLVRSFCHQTWTETLWRRRWRWWLSCWLSSVKTEWWHSRMTTASAERGKRVCPWKEAKKNPTFFTIQPSSDEKVEDENDIFRTEILLQLEIGHSNLLLPASKDLRDFWLQALVLVWWFN